MATWSQISGTIPQYFKETINGGNGPSSPASGYFIKFYNASNVPIQMASDKDGGGLLDKAVLDSSGYPLNGSSARFIPLIDQDYKIAFYRNADDADNNNTSAVDWFLGPYFKLSTQQDTDAAGVITSVSDGGLVCDGSTDDSAALTTFISSFGGSQQTIEFNSGNCRLNSSITFPENISVNFRHNSQLIIPTGTDIVFEGSMFALGGYPFAPVSSGNFGSVKIGTNIEDKGNVAGVHHAMAQTFTDLITGSQAQFKGSYGPTPNDSGYEFVGMNDDGDKKIYGAIQCEIENSVVGTERGRIHFLTQGTDFLEVVGTWQKNGDLIVGPGAPAYEMEIAGEQRIGVVEGDGVIYGERLGAQDPDNADARVIAARNLKLTDLNDLSYTVGYGFSVLNTAGKEAATGQLKARYHVRAATNEASHMYFQTLVGGAQIEGPYFYDNGIGFDSGVSQANKFDFYEETGTATLTLLGSVTNPTLTGTMSGIFTRVGNLVTLMMFLNPTITNAGSGNITIGGLPFTIINATGGAGAISLTSFFTVTGNPAGLRPQENTTTLALLKRDSADARDGVTTNLTSSDLALTTGSFYATIQYLV